MKRERWVHIGKILLPAATVLWAAFIFSNSLRTGEESGSQSGFVVDMLERALSFFGIRTEISETVVRKGAHFAEYFILGTLLLACVRVYRERWKQQIFLPLFWGLLIPVCDEFLQLSVAGRSGQVSDVVLDFSGVLTGVLILSVLLLLWETHDSRCVLHRKR